MADKDDRDTSLGGWGGWGSGDSPSESRGGPGAGAGQSAAPNDRGSEGREWGGAGTPAGGGSTSGGGSSSSGGGRGSEGREWGGAGGSVGGGTSSSSEAGGGRTGSDFNGPNNGYSGGAPSGGLGSASGWSGGERGGETREWGGAGTPAGTVGQGLNTAAPSFRETEIASMQAYQNTPTMTTSRRSENESMAKQGAWESALSLARRDAAKSDPYNSLVYGNNTPTHANLTGMTIRDVMDYQRGMKAAGHASTAVGGYQFVADTLARAVNQTGLSLDTKFSKSTQDFLAMQLMENRAKQATVDGKVDVDRFSAQLAKEWASFKQADGKGAYDGTNGNKGYVEYADVRNAARSLVESGALGGQTRSTTQAGTAFASTPSTGPIPGSRSFDEKYLGGKPASTVTSPAVASTPTEKPADKPAEKERPSLGKQIAAGALDVGIGLLPGIGTAASLVNGGLTLTGRDSIGTMIIDKAFDGSNLAPSTISGEGGSGYRPTPAASTATTTPTPTADSTGFDRFVQRYLDVSRPTPNEKWARA